MRKKINTQVRRLLFFPLVIAIALAIALFTSLFAPGGRLADLNFTSRLAINLFNLSLYYLVTYAFFGTVLAWAMERHNWPWVPVQIVFYLPLALVTGAVDAAAETAGFNVRMMMWSALTSMAMVTLAVTIVVLAYRPRLEKLLDDIGKPGCLFRAVRPPDPVSTGQFPPEKLGKVLMLRSANQYVELHGEAGTELHRMPLRDAMASLEPGLGLRINRSVWIAFSHIDSVTTERGKTTLRNRAGETLSVSRRLAGQVVETLRQRGF